MQEVTIPHQTVQIGHGLEPRRIHRVQNLHADYVQAIIRSAELSMWRVFCAVRRETRVCQDAVLRAASRMVDQSLSHRWPKDRRSLDKLLAAAKGFRSRVLRCVTIDMTAHNAGKISFRFLDPVYAWASTAWNCSKNSPLYFKYVPRYAPRTRQRLYGTSVQCGDVMKKACELVATRSTPPIHMHTKTPCQYTLPTYCSIHTTNQPYQYTLSIYSMNSIYEYML